MSKKRPDIEHTDERVILKFGRVLPHEIPKGHQNHRGGAGLHGQRKRVRIRGNQAKRQWLDNEQE